MTRDRWGVRTLSDAQWAQAERIPGWFGKSEAAFLFELIDGRWCEIGCYKGRSTVVFAQTRYRGWAVDHFKGSPEMGENVDTFDEFMENIGPYPDVTVLPYKLRGAAPMVPDDLRFLFLDADHSYEGTRLAFQLYAPKVESGGVVAFHDAKGDGWPDVERFIREEVEPLGWTDLGGVELTRAFRKR